ncbi:MAG: glycosyltransferase family 4 protein [bacterium]|nr:glycosyltransferase family 4 protein [bacterium]
MKILHIIDSLGLGGAQSVVKGIFEAQKDNKSIFLFALRKREITTEINHENVSIFNSSSKYSLAPLFALKKLIEREKIDILHCHLFRSNVFGWLLKVIWFPKIKLIFHEHGSIAIDGIFYRIFLRLSRKSVILYIAVSQAMKRALVTLHIPEEKITVLYNFVDTKKFSRDNITWNIAEERKKLGIPADAFVVGFAGRLIELKGWREFIEAARIIGMQDKSVRFVMAGDGPDREKMLRKIAQYGILNRVAYLGYVSDMWKFYSILDCFVASSSTESFGIAILEARSMAVPVIASNVPGLEELVTDQENGLLFEAGNSEELSNKIGLLKEDSESSGKMVRNGLSEIPTYSLDAYITKLTAIWV